MTNSTRRKTVGKTAGIGDEAVRARTGRGWEEWFKILDKAGAEEMTHKEIAAFLHERYIDNQWWSQTVTVAYEQARGLREKYEKPTGFDVGRSKTIPVPVETLFDAWKDARVRRRWLEESGLTVRTTSPNKSMRFTWLDGKTVVVVNFYDKGRGKSQVTVQHTKLKNKAAVEKMKRYWGDALNRLYAAIAE